ncbi:MAG: hypothetical protein J6W60_00015, partial [Treponema sp.]|nr:hypothetical protein [Treponema sp.]
MSRTRNFGSGIFGFLAILVCFAFSLTACQVGLGAAVDTSDPRVGVIIPNSGSAVGGSTIHIAGTCEDDTGIAEVQIVQLVNRDTGREYNDLGNASLSDNGRAWSIDLTRVGSSTSTYMLNGRELYLPDGGYQITVLPVDIGGRTPKYGVDRTFDIDNTPPFFLISSPNSTNIADPSPYGTTVKIKGTVYDKHEVRDINAFVYTPSGAPVALQKTGDMEAVLSKDKSSFEVILAKQNSTADAKASGNYGVLYPGSSEGKYYMEVELEDSVNVGTDLPGNKSSMVYFRANLFNILKKELGVTTINAEDLITGYNGTNPNLSSEQCEKLKKIMDGTYSLENDNSYTASEKIYYAKASTTNDGRLAFLVNPNNTPKYSFGGMAYTDSNPQGGKAAAGGSISLSVTSSSDEYMIRPDSIVVKLTAVDESGTPLTPSTVYYSGSGSSDGFSVTTDGINGLGSAGIDAATYIVTLPDNLTETYYKLELSQGYGYNLEHSDDPTYNVNLSATNTDGYGFMVYSNKIPVTISTNDDATYVAKDGSNQYQLTVTVSDPNDTPTIKTANGSIKYQMQTIQGYRSKDQLTWPEPTNSNTETIPGTSGAITGSGPDYSLTLSGLGFNVNNDTVGTIAIRIWGDNGTESEKKVFVRYVDNKVPTLTVHNDDELRNAGTTFIREINPNYSAIEGKYTISGTWKDTDGSGVQSLQYTTAASPTDGDWINIVTPYANRIINELSWSIQIPVSDGTMSSLKIRAKDLVGNENVKTYTGIKFDFGDPVFSNVPALTKANYINKTGTTFTPKATDGFGLLSLNVTAKLHGTTVQPSNNGYTLTVTDTDDKSKTATIEIGPTDNSDGEWEIELTATDLNGRTTPAKFGFMFDHTA